MSELLYCFLFVPVIGWCLLLFVSLFGVCCLGFDICLCRHFVTHSDNNNRHNLYNIFFIVGISENKVTIIIMSSSISL